MQPCDNKRENHSSDDQFQSVLRQAIILEEIRHLGFHGHSTVDILDLGYGQRTLTGKLKALGHVDTVDLNLSDRPEEMARKHQRRLGRRYHLITALDLLGRGDDDSQVVSEMCGLLRPQGKLIVTAPALGLFPGHGAPSAYSIRYNMSRLRRLLQDYGRILHLHYLHPHHIPAKMAEKLTERLTVRSQGLSIKPMSKMDRLFNELLLAEYKITRLLPPMQGSMMLAVLERPLHVYANRPTVGIRQPAIGMIKPAA